MSSGGTELRHRGPKSLAASVSFPPQTLPSVGSRKSDGIRSSVTTTTYAGRKVRVGLQLPVNYVPKGQGNAYWNKNYSIRVSLDRRARDRRRRLMPRSSPDPAVLQQQMMLQHQRQMLVMQAQRAAQGMDSEDEDCGRRARDKSGMRQKAKAIFAFLMLPSLIVVFNSHKKLHKEESNVDLSALKAGGFGGLGGMGGGGGHGAGIPGMPGFGAGAGAGMRPGMGHGMPDMEDREVPGVMSHRHPGMAQHESADEFTRRMMSQYRRPDDEEAMDPGFDDESRGPIDEHGDEMEDHTKKEEGDGEAPEELDVENLEAEADVEQGSISDAAEAEMQLPSTTTTRTDKGKDVRLEEKVEPMDDAPDRH